MAHDPRKHEADLPRGEADAGGRSGGTTGWAAPWLAKARRLKPVRVLQNYSQNRGPLLAAGLSFHAIFGAFASLWIGFSVGGLLLEAQPALRDAVFQFIDRAVPGLIDTGSGVGVIRRSVLLEGRVLSWTGAVALVGLLLTALGWLASSRAAIRTIFNLPRQQANPLVLRLKDVGLAVGFGLAILVSAGLTLVATQALGLFRNYLDSSIAEFAARVVGLLVMFLFDAAALATLFRVLAGIRISSRRLVGGVLIGAAGLAVLKILGGRLFIGAGRNPLLASFAAIVGLMIWFNLVSQIILIAASWIAVGARDEGVGVGEDGPPAPKGRGRGG